MTAEAPGTVELLERLVAFDTVSANGNLDCIGFIRGHLARHGVESRLTHDDSGTKANLYATIGPADRPGVALSGHVDVVPVAGRAWSGDPFRRRRENGRLIGRVSYGTEGGIFQQASMAAIVCGPGDIAQAHTPDEWIAESELAACDAFLRRLGDRLAA